MVNYCFVEGCGRNSRIYNHLNFYSLPKEKKRMIQWLKAAGREDLISKDQSNIATLTTYNRVCSRHFSPLYVKKNRRLSIDAVPTLFLPGCDEEDKNIGPLTHADIVCNSCSNPIVGYRYKCVSCPDFDLCQKCEMLDVHFEHYMLRIPKPIKYKFADNLVQKWREFFKAEHVTPAMADESAGESSDDEPITKYAKNYDSGVDLSDDVKEIIRKEIHRVVNLKPEAQSKKRSLGKRVKHNKRIKFEKDTQVTKAPRALEAGPEVAFADVNELKDTVMMDLKPEFSHYVPVISSSEVPISHEMVTPQMSQAASNVVPMSASTSVPAMAIPTLAPNMGMPMEQPVMHVKLSDDLTQLMIEVTSHSHENLYNFTGNT